MFSHALDSFTSRNTCFNKTQAKAWRVEGRVEESSSAMEGILHRKRSHTMAYSQQFSNILILIISWIIYSPENDACMSCLLMAVGLCSLCWYYEEDALSSASSYILTSKYWIRDKHPAATISSVQDEDSAALTYIRDPDKEHEPEADPSHTATMRHYDQHTALCIEASMYWE